MIHFHYIYTVYYTDITNMKRISDYIAINFIKMIKIRLLDL